MTLIIIAGAGLAVLTVLYAAGYWKGREICREASGGTWEWKLILPAGYLMAVWYERLMDHTGGRPREKVRRQLGKLLVKKEVETEYRAFQLKRFARVWILLAAGFTIAVLSGWRELRQAEKQLTSLTRPEPGNMAEEYQLEAEGAWEGRVVVEGAVKAREYTQAEIAAGFETVYQQALTCLPGNNSSLDQVTGALTFLQESPVPGIQISWRPEEWEYIGYNGEILADDIPPEGIITNVVMTLSYREQSAEYVIPCRIMPKQLSESAEKQRNLSAVLEEKSEEFPYEKEILLPEMWDEAPVSFYQVTNMKNSILLGVLGAFAGILYFSLTEQRLKEKGQERDRQLLTDYPEIVSKLTVLIGAGLTVRGAWERIVRNYSEQLEAGGDPRYIYEEMLYTYRGIQSGQPEVMAYRDFGKRCGLQQYRRLTILLEQNLKKGGKDLSRRLKLETEEAFSARIHQARRKGEQMGTKMMIPMFLMFILVLVLIMIPAVLSFSSG